MIFSKGGGQKELHRAGSKGTALMVRSSVWIFLEEEFGL